MAETLKVDFRKLIDDLKEKVKKTGRLDRKPIVYYSVIEDVDNEGSYILVLFVEPKLLEIFEEVKDKFEDEGLSISVFKGIERKFLREYLEQLIKDKYAGVKVGKEISGLSGSGYAVYMNWAGEGKFVIHRYENGKFLKKTCKRTPYWETENGLWMISFETCEDAKSLCGELNQFISESSDRKFTITVHRLCIDEKKECGGSR